ncbi:MAG: MFS transporter [Ilumatobacter sp.]|uniref:MFS transporter n=1 Tax=Ilumatobacter sp. TaxID=1967498 RepID=UPI003918DA24
MSGRLGRDYVKLFASAGISNLGDGIGAIAYPWLASAVTRSPLLIALVFVVQRVPWLVFSLPAGVITDRVDRRTLMIRANVARTIITLAVAVFVLARGSDLPSPDMLDAALASVDTDIVLYLLVLFATLLLGIAEVFYDNAGQTFMPAIVHRDDLEKANGRLWSAEQVANTFVGPPLGAALLVVSFSMPFFVDAATFAVSAALIALITTTKVPPAAVAERQPWRTELADGFRWLWHHELLRPMAIILGCLNALGMLTFAVLVLFAQEVLDTSPTEFALLQTGGALGAVIGGWTASSISRRIGSGPSLWLTMLGSGTALAVIGVSTWWGVVWLMFGVSALLGTLWNVITVSLRQAIIPDHLLGRVNSVYRFFAWGMMPIGSILGGLSVTIANQFVDRGLALRLPWFIAAGLHLLLFAFAAPRLTTAKIDAARASVVEN